MAKRVTIPGSNLLNDTSQPWGGTGDGSQVHGQTVPVGAEWGINKAEVERFIKAQFGTKFGDFRTTDPDQNGYIHILAFATQADAAAYDEDPVGEVGRIKKDLTIPISTASTDSYTGRLTTSRSTATQYLVRDGASFEVPLRFNAIHVIAATSSQEYMSGNGTLIVERSQNGNTWTQVKTQQIAASSDNSGYPVTLDLKGLLLEGTLNMIRLRVTFPYTDNEGASKTLGTTPIVLNINSVSLSLEMTTAWHEPQVDPSALSLAYTVRGTVSRTLHLKVKGSAGTYETTQSLTAAQTSASFSLVEIAAYGLLTHGIKTCEAWLTAGDVTAGELESDHLIVRIMVVRTSAGEQIYMQPKLLVSEMREEVENFVQTRLLAYAIYSPSINQEGNIVNNGPAIPTTFILTNSANSIISAQQNIYTSILVNPSPGTKYYLDMTVEIEQDGDTLSSFLHATREDGGVVKDFLLESIGEGNIYLRVDNTGGFQPTSGSTFLLNPKMRNNDEANPMTILNAKNDNALIPSTWTNFRLGNEDGYIKDSDGEACLRVPAGRTLNIEYNPLALLYRSPNASLNMEFDICIRNVTNEDDPILVLAEQIGNIWRGLRLLPMIGYMTTESWNSEEESDFRYQEDVRTHIAINIVNAVYPNAHGDALTTPEKAAQAQGSFPLVRVMINGIINRELVYTPSVSEFCTGAMSNGGITIGQDGADIDIYGIRIWEGQTLTPDNVFQDYISTLPDSDMKRRLKAENAIIDPNTGLIGLDYITGQGSVTGIKKNALIWHGNEPYHENAHKGETGWLEIYRYDSQGNYLPELSGKICEATKSIPQKNQGTTAKTYYYHNIQVKIQDAEGTIDIAPSQLHSSITAEWDADYIWKDSGGNPTGETGAWMIKGGYLGKNFPLPTESAQPYHGTSTSITVPDGWIDGNGKYRGVGYQVAEGVPMAQKLVNKINYASSMQSHLIGINWLYNELHTAIVGKNTMQNAVQGAVVAKHTEPFLFFTQAEGSDRAVFRGPCAWGAGKMDKPSWGYVKSAHGDFCMIEGADNDKQLTDMRVPWDDIAHGNQDPKVFYDPDEEAFYYRLQGGDREKCIDWDGGKTDANGYPAASIVNYIRSAWNFLYLHAPRIRHYEGTLQEFMVDAEYAERTITAETTPEERARIELAKSRVNKVNKYWCHAEGGAAAGDYLLKRYDYTDGEWVDAGLWNGSAYAQIDLRTYSMTAAAWNALTEAEKNQSDVVNRAFVNAIVADARTNIGSYFNVTSLKFHYCFENHFIAGTDNCSKNTYYVLDPVTHLFELHQDDVDTTLATDNSGLQSKPYYIDRMHPYAGANANKVAMTADVDNDIMYEGYYNVLFDLCELMWEPTGDLQSMTRDILSRMASLTGGLGSVDSSSMSGVWRALNRYIFDIQRYFPATVFNEAARIRYELPELIGFLSDIRSIHPIKQSMGDQLQAELQFMKRRLVYMASYAAFGEFTPTSLRQGLTGLAEATESFGMQKFALPGSSSPSAYLFKLVPHQWLYPTGGRETSNLIDPHVRVAPGAANMPDGYFEFNIDPGQASDLGVNVFGLNYYRELGNVGDMVANNGQANFTLNGRRLTKFEAVPTVFYTDEHLPAFRVNNIIIGSATRLKEFNVKGAVIGTGTLNLSALTLCESVDLRDTSITQVRVPETSTLTDLKLPATLTALALDAQPSLAALTLDGVSSLASLSMTGCPLLMGSISMLLIESMRVAETAATSITLKGINWDGTLLRLMRYLIGVGDAGSCVLEGSITMPSGQIFSYNEVATLMTRYGNIRSESNTLYISYPLQSIGSGNIGIGGRKFIVPSWIGGTPSPANPLPWIPTVEHPDAGLWLTVDYGNNVLAASHVVDGQTVWGPDVTFALVGQDDTVYAEFPDAYSPVLMIKSLYQGKTLTVRTTVHTTTATLTYDKTVGLWNRAPEVGDFAWTDGTFDKEDDLSKKFVGPVIMREVLETDSETGDIKKARIWVQATANASAPASSYGGSGGSSDIPSCVQDGSQQGMTTAWGMYPSSNALGFKDTKSNNVYTDEIMAMIQDFLVNTIGSHTLASDLFDTPLSNLSTDFTISPSTYQDNTQITPVNGAVDNAAGTTRVTNQPVGDGLGYKQRGTGEAVSDFSTIYNNKTVMTLANNVLKALIVGLGIDTASLPQDVDPQTYEPKTRQAYADLTLLIQRYIAARLQSSPGNTVSPSEADLTWTDGNGRSLAVIRELMFPAFRLANVWSPADISGNGVTEDSLDAQYKRGKWMLPSNGLLARIFNFLWNSSAIDGTRANSADVRRANANENVANEAQLPLYSNLLERSDGRRTCSMSVGSYHWSSTEGYRNYGRYVYFNNGGTYSYGKYNSSVVRPVAAFIWEA